MKNILIILAAVSAIALAAVLSFNSSGQASHNNEGIGNITCACNCR